MDASGNHEPYIHVPASPTGQGVELHMAATSEPGPIYSSHQPSTINQLVHNFLNNVKRRFGQDSFQVTSIWNALGEFQLRRQSKKDTFVAMYIALSNHNDLKQDLMNVLFHQEADWDAGDFGFHLPRPFTDHRSDLSDPFYESHPPNAPLQETAESSEGSPYVLGIPVAVPLGQLVDDMSSPPKKRCLEGPGSRAVQEEAKRTGPETASRKLVSSITVVPPPVPQPEGKKKAETSQTRSAAGPYIHSLCGKGFSSRSRVKKHHWGYVIDDADTTTGCWAKHGKPDVSWHEHPSCKEGATVSKQVKKTPSVRSKRESLQQKAPMAPCMIPALQDPPQTVAPATDLPGEYQHVPQDMGLCHSNRLPDRSSFNSLLTAVNVASQIDAPRSQGCIDSAVSHIDAQAAAAERNRQYVAAWQDTSGAQDEEEFAHGYQHPYTKRGLGVPYSVGGYHVSLKVALPSYSGVWAHAPSMPSPIEGNWVDDCAFTFDDAHSSRARIEPLFFPEPNTSWQF